MALTPSSMVPLGTEAPDFSLVEPRTGHEVSLADVSRSKDALLVMFICNHCPFVVHVNEELVRLGHDLTERNVGVVAISSNDVESHPQDGPELMAEHAEQLGYPFPYLFDADQSVALAYSARCTPDFFLFDRERKLAYRGQLDSSRPGSSIPCDAQDLRAAVDAVLDGKGPVETQRPSAGCNIKWSPGNEPE
ncbi:MAG: thioredoxin family protein [Planctomycetota bacterium]